MNVRLRFAAVLVAVPLAAAPLSAQEIAVPDSVTPEKVMAGNSLFHDGSCVFCHAPGGIGEGANAPDLSDADWLHGGSYEEIHHTLWWGVERDEMAADPPFRFEMHPRGGMPWTGAQTRQVAAYVWSISRPSTSEFVAAQAEMVTHARNGQAVRAAETYRKAAERWPDAPLLTERGINRLGYAILEDDTEGAVALFELNAEIHPDSWNVWDSLAEGHMRAGRDERAVELYRKSLELNPDNDNAREKLAELGQ